jgi:hypothetical protein
MRQGRYSGIASSEEQRERARERERERGEERKFALLEAGS